MPSPVKTLIPLFLLGLFVASVTAYFQPAPGYMDADYYYAGGLQLARGQGFTEPFLWNYLNEPDSLPQPAFTYWMPLTALISAAGLAVSPQSGFLAVRISFILIAGFVPVITAALAFSLTGKRKLAVISGVLAAFSGLYAPFMSTTDSFGLTMLLGGMLSLLLKRLFAESESRQFILLGIISGLMHLTRADGLIWLVLAFVVILFMLPAPNSRLQFSLFLIAGYFLVMFPWYGRNLQVFGVLFPPGSGKTLWLTSYDALFTFPASGLSFETWAQAGLCSALEARLWALGINLQTTLAVQGSIFLLPMILLAGWQLRKEKAVQVGLLAWLAVFASMTFLFPFAGARGGFFHSGAAIQPLWWALAPVGLNLLVAKVSAYFPKWKVEKAQSGFQLLMVISVALLTALIIATRVVIPSWGAYLAHYKELEQILRADGAQSAQPVIVANPPGYFVATDRPAIVVPDGDYRTILAVGEKFGARYLILETGSIPVGLQAVYDNEQIQNKLRFLGDINGSKIFAIP